MEKILVINTGGTFNKRYNPLTGELEVDKEGQAVTILAEKWKHSFELLNIIGKDSLEMTGHDRLELLATIHQSEQRNRSICQFCFCLYCTSIHGKRWYFYCHARSHCSL